MRLNRLALASPRRAAQCVDVNFFDLIQVRRSVRRFETRPVDAADLRRVLEAANRAPSAGNLQPYRILIVRSGAVKRALCRAALEQEALVQAPVVLAFVALPKVSAARYRRRGAELYAVQDATIACAYAQLAATALGLATVWIGAFDDDAVAQVLRLREEERPVALLPLGYAAEAPAPTPRKPLAELAQEFAAE